MGRHFSPEQRQKVIELHTVENYSTRRLAEEFGIARSTIQNWLRAYRLETSTEPMASNRHSINQSNVDPNKAMMLNEIKMQIEVLETFQNELERWDQQN